MSKDSEIRPGNLRRELTKEELQFLPATLEIVESPPSPIGRGLSWLLISLFLIALTWSILGMIDEVAVASGKVVPSGYTKIVQAEDKGIVSKILVQNGSRVKAGDLLIELDTIMSGADVSRLRQERNHFMLTLRRLSAEALNTTFDTIEAFETQDLNGIDRDELEMQLRLYRDRAEEYASRIRVAEKSIDQAEESLKQANSVAEKLRIQVKMAGDREKKTREVAQKGGISNFAWQEYLEKFLSLKQDLSTQQSEILRIEQAIEQNKAELQRIKDERNRDISTQTVEVSRNLRLTEEELKKAEEKHRLMQIRSPIDGIVQQLEIHTTGAVVTTAQPLLLVVPDTGQLQFEVWAMNRDIGFIYEGQASEIKVETFNFQKFGTIDAMVQTVATEAVEDQQRGLIYRVLLSSDVDHYMVEGKRIALIPGMAVTAEIKTRQKRVIEYFLEPFKTYVSEGFRER
jgi:hemolysin D